MLRALSSFGALFTAVLLLLTGNGLLNTLLSIRMTVEQLSVSVTGIILSCYFMGLLMGSFVCHHLVEKVGHIRAFTVFAAGTTATTLLHGLYFAPMAWGTLRFVCGMTTFGLFMVIESWLHECTESRYRGRVFSIYMTLCYLGIGIGQQLLNVGEVQSHELFIIAGIIFSLCLIPVSATESVHPQLPERKKIQFVKIFRAAPIGMLGSMAAGLTNSSFFAMMPLVCHSIGMTHHQLSWIMSITVFCGLSAQWVVGSLSDRFDRTIVLTFFATVIAVSSALMFSFKETTYGSFWVFCY